MDDMGFNVTFWENFVPLPMTRGPSLPAGLEGGKAVVGRTVGGVGRVNIVYSVNIIWIVPNTNIIYK